MNTEKNINLPYTKDKTMPQRRREAKSMMPLIVFLFATVTSTSMDAQTLKNKGTFINTGTATYNTITNYQAGTGGTIANSGILTASSTFDNNNAGSVVRNYIGGTSAGTIQAATLSNGVGTYDNDSLNTYVGLTRVSGSFTNSGTIDTDSGAVEYYGGAGQTVLPLTYGTLVSSVGGTKTMSGTVTVLDTFRITTGATFALGATTDSLAIRATSQTVVGTFTTSLGAINFFADANQSIQGGQYQRLYLSGATAARSKTTTSGLSFASSGVLNVAANDTLVVSGGNLDLSTNSPTFTNNSAIKVLVDASFHGGITTAGTFYYAGTGGQNIGAVTYANLRLGGSGGKTLPNGSTVAVTGTYSIDAGAGARTYTGNTFQFAGTSGSQTISGLSETFNLLQFAGAATKTISGTSLGAARVDILGASGTVTNNLTTFTITNISAISFTVASGTTFVQGTGTLTTTGGDVENDGTFENNGTITVN